MIAKITSGSGFGGTERYIEDYNGRDNKIVEELDHKGVDIRIGHDGQLQVNPAQVALSFREQADLNPNVSKPVGHTCLSFHPKDAPKLTNEKMLEIAHKYMDRIGIKDTQYHIVRHNEKNNPHCHIVWNRVDENGKPSIRNFWTNAPTSIRSSSASSSPSQRRPSSFYFHLATFITATAPSIGETGHTNLRRDKKKKIPGHCINMFKRISLTPQSRRLRIESEMPKDNSTKDGTSNSCRMKIIS